MPAPSDAVKQEANTAEEVATRSATAAAVGSAGRRAACAAARKGAAERVRPEASRTVGRTRSVTSDVTARAPTAAANVGRLALSRSGEAEVASCVRTTVDAPARKSRSSTTPVRRSAFRRCAVRRDVGVWSDEPACAKTPPPALDERSAVIAAANGIPTITTPATP